MTPIVVVAFKVLIGETMTDNGPQHYTEQQVGCWEYRFRDETWCLQKPAGFDFSHTYLAWHIQLDFLRTGGIV